MGFSSSTIRICLPLIKVRPAWDFRAFRPFPDGTIRTIYDIWVTVARQMLQDVTWTGADG
jgi:hypothetical protein